MSLSKTIHEAEAIFAGQGNIAEAPRVLRTLREHHSLMVERDRGDRATHKRVHGGMANPHAERDETRQIETVLMGRFVASFADRVSAPKA